jgi:hypothetical protein
MKIVIRNISGGNVSLPSPLPLLKINDQITEDIEPEAYFIAKPALSNLVGNGLIDIVSIELTSSYDGLFTLDDDGGTIRHENNIIAQSPLGRTGWIYVYDVEGESGGSVSNKDYQDPNNTVLQSATSSGTDIRIFVRSSYPLVEINSIVYPITQDAGGGFYSGSIVITISESGDIIISAITADNNIGAQDTIDITLEAPPVLQTLQFTGPYPGAQTELKEDDEYTVTGTTDIPINAIEIIDYEAGKNAVIPVTGTSFTEQLTIADRGTTAVLRPARIRARSAATDAWGPTRDTNVGGSINGINVVNCNNLFPTATIDGINYPPTQQALKGSEQATVDNTVANHDTVLYSDPTASELNIPNTTTVEDPKTVTRVGGSYNVSSPNFRITANRAANDATTVTQDTVNIANVVAQATVSFTGTRIRSGVAPGNDTTITLGFDQQMQGTPTMDPAAGRGTFIGSWSGGPTSWTRDLRVPDSENPADGSSNSWINVSATNLAGIVTNIITTGPTYIIGGFTQRTLNYPPLTANSTETFPLTTEGNLSVGVFSNGNAGVIKPFGTPDTSDAGKEGWCAPTAASGVAVQMHMLHIPSVQANGAGLTLTLVEETA